MSTATATATWPSRWQRFAAASLRAFHAYANWLVGISWRRFAVLAVLLLIGMAFLKEIPPFSWSYTRQVPRATPRAVVMAPAASAASATGAPWSDRSARSADGGLDVKIGPSGIRIGIGTTTGEAASAASAASTAPGASAPSAASSATDNNRPPLIDIRIRGDSSNPEVRQAVEEARQAIEEAIHDAHEAALDAAEAARDGNRTQREVAREAKEAARELARAYRPRQVSVGEFLPDLALFWIVASAIVKITYKRQIQAEAQAAQAVETAEAESLKRQVVEARMAAMQAQVEPHFLFNTLASIDHLIEVDPQRASQMQKNLIALLRASMPSLREASDGGVRDLGRELAMIRPYLEILKVRMEERLTTQVDVPEGLLSAEFPPMMLQTLTENAIKHGLEPKPEGGSLKLKAEIVHGKLAVSVADTGLGFGRAAIAGGGVGLANIRERLQLLYANKASLTIAENPGGGTLVTIALPYRPVQGTAL